MNPASVQVPAVQSAVEDIPASYFAKPPSGWHKKISIALIDAIYSAQQRYLSSTPGKGVFNRVVTFQEEHPAVCDDLAALTQLDEAEIRAYMGNNVIRDGRLTPKSVAVLRTAEQFLHLGVQHHYQVTQENKQQLKTAYTSIPGLGWVTFDYFLMLLGHQGIKPDTMITGFVNDALQKAGLPKVREREAGQILQEVHESLGLGAWMTLTDFDHAVWLWQRTRR